VVTLKIKIRFFFRIAFTLRVVFKTGSGLKTLESTYVFFQKLSCFYYLAYRLQRIGRVKKCRESGKFVFDSHDHFFNQSINSRQTN